MAEPLSTVLTQSRAYLNDSNSTMWTDQALIPLVKEAHREMQGRLWNVGSPLVRGQSNPIRVVSAANPNLGPPANLSTIALTGAPLLVGATSLIVAGFTTLFYPGASITIDVGDAAETVVVTSVPGVVNFTPALLKNHSTLANIALTPPDFLTPTNLQEASSPTPGQYIPMTETAYFPIGYVAQNTLTYWSWQEENLLIAPTNADRLVIIQYRRKIPIPNLATESIGILFGEMYLSPRTAALAQGTLGQADGAKLLTDIAVANFQDLVTANRGQQKPPVRP